MIKIILGFFDALFDCANIPAIPTIEKITNKIPDFFQLFILYINQRKYFKIQLFIYNSAYSRLSLSYLNPLNHIYDAYRV